MAHIPSLEETIVQIRKSIGSKQHAQEGRFSDSEVILDNHIKIAQEILVDIFSALDMSEMTYNVVLENFTGVMSFIKALELRVWTGNASQQQVLWHMLAYSYTPYLARILANWSLADVQDDLLSMDAGMPGGKFWYLPHLDKSNAKLEMPVTQVINWLLDLLGCSSIYTLEEHVESINSSADLKLTIRTLHNWRVGRLPKNTKKIDELFSDDASLNFKGSFSLSNTLSLTDNFDAALNFVKSKNLTNAESLHDEIPMSVARLEAIFTGNVPENEKEAFINHIATRFAQPLMSTIRQRIKVSRMMQDGYKRLLNFLCPDIAIDCTDPAKNKLLQLIGLFETVYNLTIQAYQKADSVEEQDAWFESKLAPWDKSDLLLSILPSQGGDNYLLLAERLSRIFMNLETNSPLEDLIPWDFESAPPIIQRRMLLIKQQHDEDIRLERLRERVRISSPWRALLEEYSFWVVSQLAAQDNLSPKIQDMALKRMRELVETEGQKVMVNLLELGFLLNGVPKSRPQNIKQRVQQLLDKSEQSTGYEEWKAPLLRFRAKHYLFQNDLSNAIKDFKSALDACSKRAFGSLRGEVARDGFATEMVENGFIPENQEQYYRNMLNFMEFPERAPSFEAAAAGCEEFFWDTLYQPYSDVERVAGKSRLEYEALNKETIGLIDKADWDVFRVWLQKNAKTLRNKRIKEARRNSVLLSWLKMLNALEKGLFQLKAMTSLELQSKVIKIEQHMKSWRTAIAILLEAWPEQAKIADFKGQTPLMLVADNGDIELTKLLTPLSDVNAQDYKGRTVLHAAISGYSPDCVSIILECNPLVSDKITFDEKNTALHTAVRFGLPKTVNLILDEFPGLADEVNHENQTPLAMARDILENLPAWIKFMHGENRQTGSKDDYINIISILSNSSILMD